MKKITILLLTLLYFVSVDAQITVTSSRQGHKKGHRPEFYVQQTSGAFNWATVAGPAVDNIYALQFDIEGTGTGVISNVAFEYNGTSITDIEKIHLYRQQWGYSLSKVGEYIISGSERTLIDIPCSFEYTPDEDSQEGFVLIVDVADAAVIDNAIDFRVVSFTDEGGVHDITALDESDNLRTITIKDNWVGTISVGFGMDYSSLDEVIYALSLYGPGVGGVVVELSDDEVFEANEFTLKGVGSVDRPITIKRSGTGTAAPIVKSLASGSWRSIFTFYAASYTTLEGIDLQTSKGNNRYGVNIYPLYKYDEASNITLKDCTIDLNNTDQYNKTLGYGAVVAINNRYASDGDDAIVENVTVQNCELKNAHMGVAIVSDGKTVGSNTKILNNNIHSLNVTGVWLKSNIDAAGIEIIGNEIHNIESASSSTDKSAMGVCIDWGKHTAIGTLVIANNKIHNITNTSTGAKRTRGLHMPDLNCEVIVYNNMIWDISAPNSTSTDNDAALVAGIYHRCEGGDSRFYYYYNTVIIDYTNPDTNHKSTAFEPEQFNNEVASVNNIFINKSVVGGGAFVIHSKSANNDNMVNNYTSNTGNNIYYATDHIMYRSWQTTITTLDDYKNDLKDRWVGGEEGTRSADQSSNSENVVFVSADDLHLPDGSMSIAVGGSVPVATINTDIDGDLRNVSTPCIGADEISVPTMIESKKILGVHPNPFVSSLTILGLNGTSAEISSLSGQIILKKQVDNNQVDLSELPQGVYVLTIIDRTGKRQTGKIIKE